MLKARVPETDEGIQDAITVEVFDRFARSMRDRGLNNVKAFLKAGVGRESILEIGPGPGYVGLELLKASPKSSLTACEISPEMIKMAQKNAKACGFAGRTNYVEGNCMQLPFDDASFDAVFSNGSLHAAYTAEEMRAILNRSDLRFGAVQKDAFGLTVSGVKPA